MTVRARLAGFATAFSLSLGLILVPCTALADPGCVELLRDRWGLPNIFADTDEGALFALGWAAAEDRAFQMYLSVRMLQGRCAEVRGDEEVVLVSVPLCVADRETIEACWSMFRAENVTLRDNRLLTTDNPPGGSFGLPLQPIELQNVHHGNVARNSIEDSRKIAVERIQVGPSCQGIALNETDVE
jgi:hypothetical protein